MGLTADSGRHTIRQYCECMFSILNVLRIANMTLTEVASTETEAPINLISSTPSGFDPVRDLPAGFMEFFLPLHHRFTPRQQELALRRVEVLQQSLEGDKPRHHFPSDTVRNGG